MSNGLDEQLKLPHSAGDVLDCPKKKDMWEHAALQVNKRKSSYNQVRAYATKKEEWKVQQSVFVI